MNLVTLFFAMHAVLLGGFVFVVLSLRKNNRADAKKPGKSSSRDSTAKRVTQFMSALQTIATTAGRGDYAFESEDGAELGFIQFVREATDAVTIHRIWTTQPGYGNGKAMLRTVCELADRHGVAIKLKPLPFGRKPYPMDRDKLAAWYQRYGFVGNRRQMIRMPRAMSLATSLH